MTSSIAGAVPATADHASGHPVLEPMVLGRHRLANRAVVAPMSRVSAGQTGVPTGQMSDYYRSFAAGGFALVITEGIYTDQLYSRSYAHQPGLTTGDQQRGWAAIADAVHANGGTFIAQLMHGGALSQCLTETVGPSAIQPLGAKMPDYGGSGPYPLPRAMSREQIAAATEGFAAAAQRAHEAGFDGVEIHAANGYLLDQFITGYTNTRTDRYGGTSGNRIRLTAEVLAAVRAQVPSDFVIGVRLSQTKVNDGHYRWTGRSEAAVYFATVAEAGADYVHVASEGRDWHETAMLEPDLSVTSLARAVTGLAVIANGGMHRPALSAELLQSGHADLVALASGALANPDWPQRIRHGQTIDEFDHGLLHPSASLDNAERFAAATRAGRE